MERTLRSRATACCAVTLLSHHPRAGHIGLLKAKLAKLKTEVVMGPKGGSSKPGEGFDVTKSGDVRVGMVGFPSVGKSSLLTKLTGTKSEVAAYEFTTLTCIPGTIQCVDKGGGRGGGGGGGGGGGSML